MLGPIPVPVINNRNNGNTAPKQEQNILENNNVIKKLIEKQPTLHVIRNKFGNFIHEETSLVLDPKTLKVYGRQMSDGKIAELTLDDINICNKYKFQYVIPENLDKKAEEDEDELELEIENEEEEEEEVEEELDEGAGDEDDDNEEEEEVEEEVEEEFEYEE